MSSDRIASRILGSVTGCARSTIGAPLALDQRRPDRPAGAGGLPGRAVQDRPMRTDVLGELSPIGRRVARLSTGDAPARAQRIIRGVSIGLTLGILAAAIPIAAAIIASETPGSDFAVLRACAEQFWRTGSPYFPFQLAGSWHMDQVVAFAYPPTALFVVAPFAFLPWPLWWIVPLGTVGALLIHWRPAPWAWPLLALGILWPRTLNAVIVGGSDLWVTAGIALALSDSRLGALLPLLKPSVAPFGLIGIRQRRWWIGAAAGLGLIVVTLPLWFQYATVLGNVGSVSLTYSLPSLPMYAIPLVAWASRRRPIAHHSTTSMKSQKTHAAPLSVVKQILAGVKVLL